MKKKSKNQKILKIDENLRKIWKKLLKIIENCVKGWYKWVKSTENCSKLSLNYEKIVENYWKWGKSLTKMSQKKTFKTVCEISKKIHFEASKLKINGFWRFFGFYFYGLKKIVLSTIFFSIFFRCKTDILNKFFFHIYTYFDAVFFFGCFKL